jgi:glycosyltransferase involved in cell wall biosynthesis
VKILHIGKFYPPHPGGIETYLGALCSGLARADEVNVIVANDRAQSTTESIDGVCVRRLAPIATIAATPICLRMIREIRAAPAAIAHLHVPNPFACVAFLASHHPAPLIVSWHSDIVRQRLLGRLFQPIERALVRRAAALVVSSANYLQSSPTLARNRERCAVIPFGIDDTELQRAPSARVTALRERYGSRIVLAVGRLVYYKGFDHLIRAMPAVDGHLVIVGEGPLRMKLERVAVQAGVAARMSLMGNLSRDELIDLYQAAAVFVLPSVARSETFGIVQLEAMACGKPVINTRLPSGVPFVSIDGETGITVEPGAPEPLARAINRLLDDPVLSAAYGAAGRRRVREHFSLATMVDRTRDLYQQVLERRSANLIGMRNSDTDRPRSSLPV